MNEQFIERYLKGDTTKQERILFHRWVEADERNKQRFEKQRYAFDSSLLTAQENYYPKLDEYKHRRLITTWVRIAASVLVVLSVGMLTYWGWEDNQEGTRMMAECIQVPVGQRVQLTLSDGTNVWLNSNSRLSFPRIFDKKRREVTLDGEGYFEVTKSADHPFVVNTEDYEVKVLGTTFNVKSYSETGNFSTSLISGSVEVSDKVGTQTLRMRPNETVSKRGNLLYKSPSNQDNEYSWREGIYNFQNKSYEEVFGELATYYGMELQLRNEHIGEYRCTGKFRMIDGIDYTLEVLQKYKHFQYKREGNALIIY